MRAREFIVEHDQYYIQTKYIPKELNGGRIDIIVNSSDKYPVTSYSYVYTNDSINENGEVIRYDADILNKTVTSYHYSRYPEGIRSSNMDDSEIRYNFAQGVTEYLSKRIDENSNRDSANPWESCQELREISAIMDYIVEQSQITRKLLENNKK
jgi:hypothetical protein